MKARFPGKCSGGGDPVAVGDTIVKDDYGWSHPAHKSVNFGREIARVPAYVTGDFEHAVGYREPDDRAARDAEYAAGIEDARRESFNRNTFGESYAAAEEYARDLRGLNGEW